jgi:DNA-binding NarL/FixJ family response regulator
MRTDSIEGRHRAKSGYGRMKSLLLFVWTWWVKRTMRRPEAQWIVKKLAENARVLIVDDHPVMRHGLRAVIEQDDEMTVAAEAISGRSAVQAFASVRPNVVLLDIEIRDDDILSTVAALRSMDSQAVLLLMTTFPRDDRVAEAMSAGVTACFLKTSTDDEIRTQIRTLLLRHSQEK